VFVRPVLGAVAGSLFATGSAALELTVMPEFDLGSRATNNVLFTESDTQDALGFNTGGRMAVTAESALYRSSISPSVNFQRFAVGDDLDADEFGVRSQHQWQATEAITGTLQADYTQDSTLSNELTDAGRRNSVGNRNTLNLAPGLVYAFDALTQLNASFSHTDITTDTPSSEGLEGYTYQVASVGVSRLISSELQGFATGFANWFDVPSQRSGTVTYGMQTGLVWQFDAHTRLELGAGYLTSDVDYVDLVPALIFNPSPQIILLEQARQTETGGPIASFGLTHQFERTRVDFRFSRQVSPTLRGSQSLTDSLTWQLTYDWSEELSLSVSADYAMVSAQTDVLQQAANDLNRDQFNVSGAVSYQLTQNLRLRGEYRYQTSENGSSRATADGHNVALSLNYQFERFVLGLW